MTNLETTISTYADFELAFLYTFKLATYLPATQEKIRAIIYKRGLTDESMAALVNDYSQRPVTDANACPRCKSKKLMSQQVEWNSENSRSPYESNIAAMDGIMGKATYKEQLTCNVCGYWLNDPNAEQAVSGVRKFFRILFGSFRFIGIRR